MYDSFVDVEVCVDAVVLEHDDVCVLLGNDASQTLQRTRYIRHDNVELHVTAAGNQTFFYNAMNEAYIDITAGQNASNLLAGEITLASEQSRQRRSTCRLNNLLGALQKR